MNYILHLTTIIICVGLPIILTSHVGLLDALSLCYATAISVAIYVNVFSSDVWMSPHSVALIMTVVYVTMNRFAMTLGAWSFEIELCLIFVSLALMGKVRYLLTRPNERERALWLEKWSRVFLPDEYEVLMDLVTSPHNVRRRRVAAP